MRGYTGAEGQALMLVATAVAAGISKGKSLEDITLISAFLDVVGDQLALLAAARAYCAGAAPAGQGRPPGLAMEEPLL